MWYVSGMYCMYVVCNHTPRPSVLETHLEDWVVNRKMKKIILLLRIQENKRLFGVILSGYEEGDRNNTPPVL